MRTRYTAAQEWVKLTTGDIVKIAREMRGMTQSELAQKTGISPSHISEIERNRVEIGRMRAILLSKALGIPTPYIMFPRPEYYKILKAA